DACSPAGGSVCRDQLRSGIRRQRVGPRRRARRRELRARVGRRLSGVDAGAGAARVVRGPSGAAGFRGGGHLGGIGSPCGGPAERFARWNKGRFGWQRVCRRASVLLSLSRSSQAARDRSGAGAYDWSADMKRFTLMALLMAAAGVMVSGRSATQTPTAGGRLPEIEFVLSGFEVQLVYEVPLNEQGSWVSLGIGPDGSLYASDQGKTGTYRIRVGGTLDAPTAEVTRLPVAVSGAQG